MNRSILVPIKYPCVSTHDYDIWYPSSSLCRAKQIEIKMFICESNLYDVNHL